MAESCIQKVRAGLFPHQRFGIFAKASRAGAAR